MKMILVAVMMIFQTYSKLVKPSQTIYRYADATEQCQHLQEVILGNCPTYSQPAHDTATNTESQLPEAVLIQFVSPDDEHDMLETCREL